MTTNVQPRTVASIYNPDILTKEQLISSFVVRLKKFKKLFADIKSAKMEYPEQHLLVVGLRGMGKTTLLLRLSYEVENDDELNKWLLPIVFNEEEYGVTKLFKFWEKIAEYLERKSPAYSGLFEQMDKAFNESKSITQYEQAAFSLLREALHKEKKKLLLFIDNFGDMFKRFGKQEKQRLREVLMTCPELRIIAGSAVAVESFFKYDDPFYELFKIERLDGLTKEETESLLLQLGNHYPNNPAKEIIEKQSQRVETLRRLTGGIPRSIVLLFEIFMDDKDGNAFTDLESILDRVTPLYKHRMDDLSPQQQEIVNAVALNWDAISAKEIAHKTRITSKVVSAQLKQLRENNIVDVQPTQIKNNLYLLHDRFFNIWYLMRMARRSDKNRVLWFIRFLEQWCDEDQLSKRTESLMLSLNRGSYYTKGALYHTTALYYAQKYSLNQRYKLYKRTQRYLEEKDISLHEQIIKSDMAFFGKAIDLLKKNDLENAYEKLLSIKEKSIQDVLLLCAISKQKGDVDVSENYYQKAIKMKVEYPERILGNIFHYHLKSHETAKEYYEKACEKGDKKAFRYLGWLYEKKLKNLEKAELYYCKAIEKKETLAWSYLGGLYRDQKDYQKAEEFYLKAAEEGHSEALMELGYMLGEKIKDFGKAEEYYRKAISEKETLAWSYLGDLYRDQKDYQKAEEFYLKAAEEGHPDALRLLGYMHKVKLKDVVKAEEYYRKAISESETYAWANLGDLYRDQKDYQKAEEFYLKAAEEGHPDALRLLGYMHEEKLKDVVKAEEYYRKAISESETLTWRFLGDLYRDQKDYQKAEEFYLKAAEEGHPVALRVLGYMHEVKLKDVVKAEEYYRKAISEKETLAWSYLGDLYRDQKDYQKAEEFYLKAAEEGHPDALRLLGYMHKVKLKDVVKAEEYYRKAISESETYAWANLGDLYRGQKDYQKAEEFYLKAAEEGHPDALRLLGYMHEEKLKDVVKAEEYYRKAISESETYAWANLGDLYRGQKDYQKAAEFYLKAAEEGHPVALRVLGYMHEEKLKDVVKAEEYYRKAISEKETLTWRFLGDLYRDQKDYQKAEEFYLKAAEEGHPVALRVLGYMHEVKLKDVVKAEEYYRKAISEKETLAWSYLGDLYRDQKDYQKAEEFYLKAAEEGHPVALRLLGYMHEEKLKDVVKAEEYYRKAISEKETLAWSYLGDLYRGQKDYQKAEEFYLKAAEEGHSEVLLILGQMYQKDLSDTEKAENYIWEYCKYDKAEGLRLLGCLYDESVDDFKKAEEFFLSSIEEKSIEALNSLAWVYFERKIKHKDALQLSNKAYEEIKERYIAHTLACVLLWNNKFDEAKKISRHFHYDEEYIFDSDEYLVLPLLFIAKKEYDFLYDYFISEKADELQLKDRMKPIWYALLYYMQDKYPSGYLRMPPELKETVEEIIAKVKQMRIDYA